MVLDIAKMHVEGNFEVSHRPAQTISTIHLVAKRWIIHSSFIHFFLISFHSCRLLFPKTDSSHRSDLFASRHTANTACIPRARLLRSSRQMFVWKRGRVVAPPRTPTSVSAEHGRARASGQGLVHSSTFWAKRQIDDFLTDAVDPFGILRFRPVDCRVFCALGWPQGGACEQCWTFKEKIQKKKNQNTKNHVMTQGANMHYSAHNAVVCQSFNFVPLVIRYDKSSAGEK